MKNEEQHYTAAEVRELIQLCMDIAEVAGDLSISRRSMEKRDIQTLIGLIDRYKHRVPSELRETFDERVKNYRNIRYDNLPPNIRNRCDDDSPL